MVAHAGLFDTKALSACFRHLSRLFDGSRVRFRTLAFIFGRFRPTSTSEVCFKVGSDRLRTLTSVLTRFHPISNTCVRFSTAPSGSVNRGGMIDWVQTREIQHGGMFGEECWKITHFYYDFKTWKRTLLKLLFSWKLCFSSVWSYMYEGMITGMYNQTRTWKSSCELTSWMAQVHVVNS